MAPNEIAAGEQPVLRAGRRNAQREFDAQALEASGGLADWVFELVFGHPQGVLRFLRWLAPAISLPWPRMHLVLRYDEVRDVLAHSDRFPVPWADKMRALTDGENFVLGMARDKKYDTSYRNLAHAFSLEDIEEHVARPALLQAEAIVDDVARRGGEFDAVEDLVTAVPTSLCDSYYGVTIPDKKVFARASLAVSSFTFGMEKGPPKTAPPANVTAAALYLRRVIEGSIARAELPGAQPSVVMKRLVDLKAANPGEIKPETLHAYLLGMIMGFIPTNVLAGGNILETLLRRPDFLERTREAALADDDDLLWRCLRETLRFRHINPGPLRQCANGYELDAGTKHAHSIPKGAWVLASTQSAMFDHRRIERPDVFDPYRPDDNYLVFGVGQHWCLGAYIAKAQLTQTFKPLLKRKGLRPLAAYAKVKRFNSVFPLHLRVGFQP